MAIQLPSPDNTYMTTDTDTTKVYGYGDGTPSITGLFTADEAIEHAVVFLSQGKRWDKQHQRYVEDRRRNRAVEIFESQPGSKLFKKIGTVVATRYYSGNIVCCYWSGTFQYQFDDSDLVPVTN